MLLIEMLMDTSAVVFLETFSASELSAEHSHHTHPHTSAEVGPLVHSFAKANCLAKGAGVVYERDSFSAAGNKASTASCHSRTKLGIQKPS